MNSLADLNVCPNFVDIRNNIRESCLFSAINFAKPPCLSLNCGLTNSDMNVYDPFMNFVDKSRLGLSFTTI